MEEATLAYERGLGPRMMLEMSPARSFGVLSPAFRGNEGNAALERFASHGCGFLQQGRCELFGTGLVPLECRFCHHERPGRGPHCHAALEQDWHTKAGQALVVRWGKETGFFERQRFLGTISYP